MYISRVSVRPALKAAKLAEVLNDRQAYGLHKLFWGIFAEDKHKTRDFLFREELAKAQRVAPSGRQSDPVYYVVSKEAPLLDSPIFNIETKPYQPQLSIGETLSFKVRVNAVVTRDKKRHDLVMDSQLQWLKQQLSQLKLNGVGNKAALKASLLDYATDADVNTWQDIIATGPFAQVLENSLSRSKKLDWTLKTVVEIAVMKWWQRQGEQKGFVAVAQLDNEQNDSKPKLNIEAYQKHHMPEKGRNASFSSIDLTGEITITDPNKFEKALFEGLGRAKAFGCGLMMIRRV